MSLEAGKRHIGVIPPHPTRNRKFFEDFARVIEPCWRLIPHTLFYRLSYPRLIEVSRTHGPYQVVVTSRMSDPEDPENNNIVSAVKTVRHELGQSTVFIMSFNQLLASVRGLDAQAEREYIERLMNRERDPRRPSSGGLVYTSSTDPDFLITVIADILTGPQKYLDIKGIYRVESQAHFLNNPPGHTQTGIG